MKLVRSLDKNDCGICALACALERPWHEVRAAIASGRARRGVRHPEHLTGGTTGQDLIDGAARFGWVGSKCTPIKDKRWPFITDITNALWEFAIVKVHYADSRVSHWVAFRRRTVWDSNFDYEMSVDDYPYAPLSIILFRRLDL